MSWASQLKEWLFLGSKNDASNLDQLKSHGITHILNVADNVENFYPDQFNYCNLNVQDFGKDEGISRTFQTAFKFVQDAIFIAEDGDKFTENGKNHKILVHCFGGLNRSPTIATAILMKFDNLSLKEAFEYIANRRPAVDILEDNRNQLISFEEGFRRSHSSTMDPIDFTYVVEAAKSSTSFKRDYESSSANRRKRNNSTPKRSEKLASTSEDAEIEKKLESRKSIVEQAKNIKCIIL
jgi:protein-tyrosine phosphatase